MNVLDRLIGYVAPERGLRRAQARNQISVVNHAYDGASVGRRTHGWITSNASANAEVLGAQARLASRSRDLCRNDPNMISAKREVRHFSVGTGIELQLSDPRWQALWDEFVKNSDADGQLQFHGQQSLGAATIFESGSVLLRKRPRRESDGLTVPMQIQLMEPDHLDTTRDGSLRNGGWILGGIEFDRLGRRAAYWIFPVHPGEVGGISAIPTMPESRRVPASEIIHAFVMERPGQITGVPWTAGVIVKAKDLGDYEEAELYRKKIEACAVGAVTSPAGIGSTPLGARPEGVTTQTSSRPEQFEPGTFHYFGPGEDIKFNDPKGSTSYGPYVKTQEQRLGAGTGVPYAKMTGNLSDANFSSLKAGGNQFENSMDVFRRLTLIPMLCERPLQWFYEAAEISGIAPGPRPTSQWLAPPYPEVDQLKEANARLIDIRSGVISPQRVIRARGGDPVDHLNEFEAWNAELDRRKIVLDSDPRRVSRVGLAQSSNPVDNGDSEE